MGIRFRGLMTATIATAAVGAVFTLADSARRGRRPPAAGPRRPAAGRPLSRRLEAPSPPRGGASRAPRNAWDGKPNMNGVWQAINTANWDLQDHAAAPGPFYQLGAIGAVPPGQTVVEGGDIPYLPAAAEQKRKNYINRLTEDPEVKCYLPGMPRATYMPYPFQIVQSPKNILFAYEYASANRVVNMDKPTEAPVDSWMGWSNGKWEGDTLVVDVRSLNGKAWLDRAGDYMTDNAHIVERYTMTDDSTTSTTKRRLKTTSCIRAPGRSACRSTSASSGTRRFSSSSASSSPRRCCTAICARAPRSRRRESPTISQVLRRRHLHAGGKSDASKAIRCSPWRGSPSGRGAARGAPLVRGGIRRAEGREVHRHGHHHGVDQSARVDPHRREEAGRQGRELDDRSRARRTRCCAAASPRRRCRRAR